MIRSLVDATSAARVTMIAGACAAAVSMPAFAADPRPGLWEYRIEMQMPGMKLPPKTVQNCLTAKDLAERKQFAADPSSKCTMSNFRQNGDQVSYEMVCETEAGKMTIAANGTVGADAMRIETRMKMAAGGPMPEMSQVISGRRLGECKG